MYLCEPGINFRLQSRFASINLSDKDPLIPSLPPMLLLSIIPHLIAYIDPGTGSIVLQALVAVFAGAAIAVKLFWHRILKFFGILKENKADSSFDPENVDE